MDSNIESKIMELIFIAGNAKSMALKAIMEAEKKNIAESEKMLKEAKVELHKAHSIQTDFMNREFSGEKIEKTILLIHAQDHYMSAHTIIELAERFINLYKLM